MSYRLCLSINAIVEDGFVKIPMHVPNGTRVEITFLEPKSLPDHVPGSFAARYAKYVGMADDLPEDFAMNHDHYLHGAPKRS